MDAFALLSRGGTQFDKRRFNKEVNLFSGHKKHAETVASTSHTTDEFPEELDFFKYAESGVLGTKGEGAANGKSRAADSERTVGVERQSQGSGWEGSAKRGTKRKRSLEPERTITSARRVRCTGESVPTPIHSFVSLQDRYGLAPELRKNIAEKGYLTPTDVQTQCIPVLLEKRDLAAIAPTGSGKTLAYLLPVFCLLGAPGRSGASEKQAGARALIVSPTRELAMQIHNEALKLAKGRKWKVVVLNKATGNALRDKAARKKVDLLITTPLSLVSALDEGILNLDNIRHLILDEADRLLEEGFLKQIEAILAACSYPEIQKAVFSATLPAAVEAIANTFLRRPIRVIVGVKDSATDTIHQELLFCGSEIGKLQALRNLVVEGIQPPVLIFVQSIERAQELFHELLYDGLNVDVVHSERTKAQREDAVRRFRKGEVWVLIATELMARGMDFKGVNLVVNYDFPQTVQSYIHRIGRTGRAGRQGKAVTYFTKEDAPYVKSVANVLKASGQDVPQYMLDLPKPSKLKKRELKRHPIERKDIARAAGAGVGRNLANKKRDMICASKRRKTEPAGDKGGKGDSVVRRQVVLTEDE
ncbi:P-loop containing nucleoside triphosphate hydrolase protein [Dacryopinax primogenitus]|uniref:RNA helicase n=1 Tax=Dacryopinax primogenitus (strain DJM 731) TaxID=1858805 RepID=M5G3B9_DACPD|nr:P-loop containing nucleoside triphosphate hydrolase protein [Dacryopinax primogenitus]EJU04701.1 P-loop containing nucleoside triphosphate hydrolase protein [Dacryopinax primogenitus]